jgi:UDP-N-acetylmuramate--alanine ligase
MDFNNIKHAYFLGIGGIGMSAIARYFNYKNIAVSGYDKTPTPLTDKLQEEGIAVTFNDDIAAIKNLAKENTLVVLTPAIPNNHIQLNWFKQNGFEILKRSQVLGIISKAFKTIGVAGTHGKTTTSALIAHILKQSSLNCSAFLGGIATNYQTNFLIGNNNANPLLVVEADEFDRSFLTLHPFISVITSADADHLDIYGETDEIKKSFADYGNRLAAGGTLFVKHGLDIIKNLSVNFKTYGLNHAAFAFAENIKVNKHQLYFDLQVGSIQIKNINLGIPGIHNIENAVAAAAVCLELGVTPQELTQALATFKGVKRRFEYIIQQPDRIFIDDYAHHPEELKAFILSVKQMYPQHKLVVAFQPHLFSRTKDFAAEFAKSLSLADEVYLLDIYPARELPMEGVSSELIFKNISVTKHLCNKENLVKIIAEAKPALFCTLGAGDIDTLINPLKDALNKA